MFALLPVIPFLFCLVILIFKKPIGTKIGWFALPVPIFLFINYFIQLPIVQDGGTKLYQYPWVEAFDLTFSFRLDGLSLFFALIISFVGILVMLYSIFYLSKKERLLYFYIYLLIFMGSMLGVVTSDNMLLLYLFWELTSISSFLLIGYWFDKEPSRYGAQKALLITVAGGFCLFAAILLMGSITDTFSFSGMLSVSSLVTESTLYPVIVVLVLLGAFTKSAQFPFHIWLPSAMEAPTPISCYLHSATMVKAGIFLIARFTPLLGDSLIWNGSIVFVGLLSLLFGSFMTLKQKDLKALLAYSTISQLGLIVCLFGLGTEVAIVAGLFHLLNHSIFKGSLFLVTGIVDHETGTRDTSLLQGLGKAMPITALICLIASFSMAGLPPFSGFLSKEMFFDAVYATAETPFQALLSLGSALWIIPIIAVIASILTFVYSTALFLKTFLGKSDYHQLPKHPHEANIGLLSAPLILVSFNILISIMPNLFAKNFIFPASMSVMQSGELPSIHISFWHGLTAPLVLTIIVMAAGIFLYFNIDFIKKCLSAKMSSFSINGIYDATVSGLMKGSKKITDLYMTDSLTHYLLFILGAVILLIGIPLFRDQLWTTLSTYNLAKVEFLEAILIVVTAGAAFMTAAFRKRLYAILAVSVAGYMLSLFFIIFNAPDLALTQLLTESITLLLYLLVLRQFPSGMKARRPVNRKRKYSRLGISVLLGFLVGFISFLAHSNRFHRTISWYYTLLSRSKGGGDNMVNVILVDFRGLDTLGEVTVLALAAIGVLVLIRLVTDSKGKMITLNNPYAYYSRLMEKEDRYPLHAERMNNNIILISLAKPLSYLIFIVAIYLLYAGHNLPGGGFIAGLTAACAISLMYITFGSKVFQDIRFDLRMLLPAGLLCSTGCGLGGILFGKPFLTHTFGHITFPLIGELEFATSMIFDFGVFLIVIGTVMSIIFGIGSVQRS